ncbi:dihydrodipicolinate synthase family protein [Pseudoroseicyclus sp. CXY001]|uniref:dihydrodipicolinate synthase family protein n=1 Tax=Pseudoroseicyclus sp. CXY001 TaxID=3242492 RepID=UPI003570ADEF
MARPSRIPHGVYASTILPMRQNGQIDHGALAAHTAAVCAVPGIEGLLVNGHAGENAMIHRDEARAILKTARAATPGRVLMAGINAETTADALALAADAEAEGADALMIFAPFSWMGGIDPRAVLAHHRALHEASGLPIVLFKSSVAGGGMSFPPELMRELLALPRVAAIKEGSWETSAYDRTRRLARELRPDVAVMASGDEHLMTSFAIGTEGSIVSLAAVVPDLVVALYKAVKAADLREAAALHARITPLAEAIYRDAPGGLVSARLKACLSLMGRLESCHCRAPIGALDAGEKSILRAALDHALCPA